MGDDDKIYFFFSEAGKEFDFFDNTIVSRIARVCKVRHLCLLHKTAVRRTEAQTGLSFSLIIHDSYFKSKLDCSRVGARFVTASRLCGCNGNVSPLP